jgi:chemotaxis protein CheX
MPLDDLESADPDTPPAFVERQEQPLASFIGATIVAFTEMAITDVAVQDVYRVPADALDADISAVLTLSSMMKGTLVLGFPKRTATAVAERVLADANVEITDSLVRDCVAEIANVIAGQAKTLLAGTAHELTFSLPEVVVGNSQWIAEEAGCKTLIVAFRTDVGDFSLRLALEK